MIKLSSFHCRAPFCVLLVCLAMVSQAFTEEIRRVDYVLDPGHSPLSPGATSCTGKSEYRYNDSLTETIKLAFEKRQFAVGITRQANEDIPLIGRAQSAKGKKFILSIHHDSVQPQYIVWKRKGVPTSLKAQGFSIFVSKKNSHYKQSLNYAQNLGKALVKRGLKPTLHHAEKIAGENRQLIDPEHGIYLFDDLVVLKNSDAPAVLLEAAVIVHPKDENRASSAAYKSLISEAVIEMALSI